MVEKIWGDAGQAKSPARRASSVCCVKDRYATCLRRGIDSCLPPREDCGNTWTIELRRGPCLLARRGCFGEEQLLPTSYTTGQSN